MPDRGHPLTFWDGRGTMRLTKYLTGKGKGACCLWQQAPLLYLFLNSVRLFVKLRGIIPGIAVRNKVGVRNVMAFACSR